MVAIIFNAFPYKQCLHNMAKVSIGTVKVVKAFVWYFLIFWSLAQKTRR